MTIKQQQFIELCFYKSMKPTEAYLQVYPGCRSRRNAQKSAFRLMNKPEIIQGMQELGAKAFTRLLEGNKGSKSCNNT